MLPSAMLDFSLPLVRTRSCFTATRLCHHVLSSSSDAQHSPTISPQISKAIHVHGCLGVHCLVSAKEMWMIMVYLEVHGGTTPRKRARDARARKNVKYVVAIKVFPLNLSHEGSPENICLAHHLPELQRIVNALSARSERLIRYAAELPKATYQLLAPSPLQDPASM